VVGGIPSARTIVRVAIPPKILDSSDVVRATLLMVLDGPVLGGPGDSVTVRTFAVRADVGLKSPLFGVGQDSVTRGVADLPVGSADTMRIDITRIVIPWQNDSSVARSILLGLAPEASSLGEVRLRSSQSTAGAPAIHITYVPRFLEQP
jgi:hypothetical protein